MRKFSYFDSAVNGLDDALLFAWPFRVKFLRVNDDGIRCFCFSFLTLNRLFRMQVGVSVLLLKS